MSATARTVASNFRIDTSIELSDVPIPAAAWLFGSAMLGMVGIGRRRARKQRAG